MSLTGKCPCCSGTEAAHAPDCPRPSFASQEEQDRQEAGSIRQAVELQLALLSSGNWALWREGKLTIYTELDMKILEEAARIERFARETYWELYERRQTADRETATVVGKAIKSLEDMGL